MKIDKNLFWSLIIIGALSVLASLYLFTEGDSFSSYFGAGFCGITLIGTAFINYKKT